MIKRHRIPTIFNIYMVDVLCCALGAVILMWLLNLKDAKERAEASTLTSEELNLARADLQALEDKLKDSRAKEALTSEQLARLREERDKLEDQRDKIKVSADTLQARLSTLEKLLTALKVDKIKLEELVTQKKKSLAQLERDLTDALAKLATVTSALTVKEIKAKDSAKSIEELLAQLRKVEANAKDLKKDADLVPLLRDRLAKAEARATSLSKDIDSGKKNLDSVKGNVQDLEKAYLKVLKEVAARNQELADAERRIISMQGEKKSLMELLTRTRSAAENRFAGVTLSGHRVIFLVDMSGSMELVDEKTPSVTKWKVVCDTVARVMRSLPDLEYYQVIAFSDTATYPMGSAGQWLKYEDKKSADQVLRTLASLKPKGATNMYTAFETAFRYRPFGLDAIYVFSDGLPSTDPNVPQDQLAKLPSNERSQFLSQRVRTMLTDTWNKPVSGQPKVRLNAVGFFYESPEVGSFLWALSREHEGSFVGMNKP